MPNYRRFQRTGAQYFFTVHLSGAAGVTLTSQIHALRAAYAATIREHAVFCDAMVIMPDHLHAVWTLPPGDADYSLRWRKIKARFSRAVGTLAPRSPSKHRKRETGLWQRRFWEHCIRDAADYAAHVSYCWADPVAHGLVRDAADWPHSSIHRDLRLGMVPEGWSPPPATGRFGER